MRVRNSVWGGVLLFLCVACGGGGGGLIAAPVTVLATLQSVLSGESVTTVVDGSAKAAVVIELRSDGRVRFSATGEAAWIGEVTAFGIRRGAAGADGPEEIDLLASGATFDAGTLTASGEVTALVALVNEIAATPGAFYVEIRTTSAPNGLVRNQLVGLGEHQWFTGLNGDDEVNVVDAEARGAASFHVVGDQLTFVIAMKRPVATDITDAHIHAAPAGVDGGILVDLNIGAAVVDAAAGTLRGTVTIPRTTLTRILAALNAFYCNVHTTVAPAGVARGQLRKGVLEFWGAMDGGQETTVVDAGARGGVTVELTSFTAGRTQMAVPSDTQFISDINAAHVHDAPAGVDGPIVIDLLAGADFAGSDATGSAEGAITCTQAIFTRLLCDPALFYANFHTPAAPGGLVRSQLTRSPQTFFANLSGAEELTVIDPAATAAISLVFTTITRASFSLTANFDLNEVNGLHIHDGPAGANGDILADLLGNEQIAGDTMTGTPNVTGRTFARLLASPELFYVNAHTAAAPAGLARGQTERAVDILPPAGISYNVDATLETTKNVSFPPSVLGGGGGISSYSISPALPAGLAINASTGVISGTPTQTAPNRTYTVTASNEAGSVTTDITFQVVVAAPTNLAYTFAAAVYTVNTAIANNVPSNGGGAITNYQVIVGTLPAGLSLNANTGVISGTPTTAQAAANVTIQGSNATGSTGVTISITVNQSLQAPNISYTTPVSYPTGQAISPNNPTNTGGTVASYTALNTLPAGLSLNTTTGAITGTPTTPSAQANYQIQATNAAGSSTATVSITVTLAAPSNLVYTPNSAIGYVSGGFTFPNMTPQSSGGAVASYSITPALPSGLTINTTTGVIGGTPTATSSSTTYTITASNATGSTTATVTISVLP